MSRKIKFSALALIFFSSFVSYSQSGMGTLRSMPNFIFRLNGVEAAGAIHRTDSILSVKYSDGRPSNVIRIEMATPSKSLMTPGNIFSKEMRQFLRVAKKGQRLFLLITVRDQSGARFSVSTSLILE